MATVLRVDSDASLRGPRRTGQGFLRADGVCARAGVYRYPELDKQGRPTGGIRLELRPEDEVFAARSLATYEGAPITNGHPKGGVVDKTNVRLLKIGTVMGPGHRIDGDCVGAPLQVEDDRAIDDVEKRGKRQLSPGYRIDLEEKSGYHPKYGPYHAIQRNIRVNHLALVDTARGGDHMQIRMDGLDADTLVGVRVDHDDAAPRRGATMDLEEQVRLLKDQLDEQTKLNQSRQDVADQAIRRAEMAEASIAPYKERIAELEQIIAEGATTVETAAIAREKTRADEAEATIRLFDERFEKGVRDRSNLMHRAGLVMGPSFRMDDLNERQIHEAVIRRLDSRATFKGESDAHVSGRFETLLDLHGRTARSLTRFAQEVTSDNRTDAADRPNPDAKAQRLKDFRDQWKKPLPNDIRASGRK